MKTLSSLSFRVSLVMTLLISLILGAVIIVIDSQVRQTLGQVIQTENLQVVSARSAELGRLVGMYQNELRLLALQPELQAKSQKDCEAYVRSMASEAGEDISNVLLVWPDGRASTPAGTYVDVSQRPYFQDIFKDGKESVTSAPIISKGTGKPAVILARAVRGSGGKTIALLGFEMSLSKLSDISSAIQIGKTSYGWVTDDTGLVIAHPNPDAILKLNLAKADETEQSRGQNEFAKQALGNDAWYGHFVQKDGSAISSFTAKVPNTPGWRLGVNIHTSAVEEPVNLLVLMLWAIFTFGVVVSVAVSVLIARWVAKPIHAMARFLRELAEGEADLTKTISLDRKDEIGILAKDFNRFLGKLREIVLNMQQAQKEIDGLGNELEAGAQGTVRESVRIEELIVAIRNMIDHQDKSIQDASAAVSQSFTGLERLDGLITDQSSSVVEASASIEEMVGNIGSVSASVEKIAAEFAQLSVASEEGRKAQIAVRERVDQISHQSEDLMEANAAIGAIASQTNLLAMNAAIEAAHAGDAGKGFSVVSEEIRRLAETSAEQSKTINGQLTSVQNSIQSIASATLESEKAFDILNRKVATTSNLITEVAMAMAEQKEGSSQIVVAIRDMNEITTKVRLNSGELSGGNKIVLEEMGKLKTSSGEIWNSSQVVNESATAIQSATQAVAAIVQRHESTVAQMESSVGRFRV